MTTWTKVAAVATFVALMVPTCLAGRQPLQDDRSVVALLESYEQGTPAPIVLHNVETLAHGLRSAASRWVAAVPQSDRDRRRHVIALVALEAGNAALWQQPTLWRNPTPAPGPKSDGASLVEWACNFLRDGGPTEFEHVWMLASVALVERAGDDAFLRDTLGECAPTMPCNHASHAASRFPNEPRFRLARVMAFPEVRRLSNRPGLEPLALVRAHQGLIPAPMGFKVVIPPAAGSASAGSFGGNANLAMALTSTEPTDRKQALARIRDTMRQLGTLADDPAVGPEARLRIGIIHYELNELPESLADLDAAKAATDPFVGYLAHLAAGLVRDAQQRPDDAIGEYRAALSIIPHAKSAATELAQHLFVAGQREEASTLLDAVYAVRPAPFDPWDYDVGDYRFWPGDLDQLRAMVRR